MDSGMYKPIQEAAATALSLDDNWYKKLNELYENRRKLVWEIMDVLNCSYDKNQVGLFVWAKIPDRIKSAEIISDKILDKANVFITPGFIFGDNGSRYIRISLCTSSEKLKEAIKRISNIKI